MYSYLGKDQIFAVLSMLSPSLTKSYLEKYRAFSGKVSKVPVFSILVTGGPNRTQIIPKTNLLLY